MNLQHKPYAPVQTVEKPGAFELAHVLHNDIQAVARGEASKDAQQRAMKAIIEVVCRTYDMSYFPESDRDTAFAEGRRFVGNQLLRIIKTNLPVKG